MKVLVTGANDGIGLEIAKQLAAKNNEITLVARRKDKLDAAAASLAGKGHRVIVADLSKNEDVELLKREIELNKYDVLINNAGYGMYGRFTEMALEDQQKMMRLNIDAVTALSYFYLSNAKKGDALINMASTLGTTSFAGAAVYAATKAYVTSLSESLWWEYKSKDIYVMGFCPGATYTNFHEVSGGDKDNYPEFTMQTAEQVGKELIRALERRRKPKVVSGGINRFMIGLQKLMSRRMVVGMMAGFGPLKDQK